MIAREGELRSPRNAREGWCYQHVQAIIVTIDQYAEALREATGILDAALGAAAVGSDFVLDKADAGHAP
jgi:hypothetical protein